MKKHYIKPIDPLFLTFDSQSQNVKVKGQSTQHTDRFYLKENEILRKIEKKEEIERYF